MMNQNGQTHFKNLFYSLPNHFGTLCILDRLKVDIYLEPGLHFDQLLWYLGNMFLIIFQTFDLKKASVIRKLISDQIYWSSF